MTSDYRLAPAVMVRTVGTVIAVTGVALLAVAVASEAWDLPSAVMTTSFVVAAVVVVVGGLLATRTRALVHFDDEGYHVRLRRAGVRQARWREVEDAVTATIKGYDCVVLRLRDGRSTTIPVRVLDAPSAEFMADLRARLDKGHGYRRLR